MLFSLGNSTKAQGKSYPLCPCCYNQPPVFLTPEQTAAVRAINNNSITSGSCASVAESADGGAAGELQVPMASLKLFSATSNSTSALPPPPGISTTTYATSTTSTITPTTAIIIPGGLCLQDIEDHKGVLIRRRVKEGVKDASSGGGGGGNGGAAGSSATSAITINAGTEMKEEAAKSKNAQLPPPPGIPAGAAAVDTGGRGGGSGGRGGDRGGKEGNVGGGRDAGGRGGGDRGGRDPRCRGGGRGGRGRGGGEAEVSTAPLPVPVQQTDDDDDDEDDDEEDDEEDSVVENMGCNSCMHPTCKQSAVQNGICRCPGADKHGTGPCPGTLILDVNSKPNWKLACNQMSCNTLIRFHGDIHNITPQPRIPCPECGVRTAVFEFNKLKTPLPGGATTHVGCVVCDEFLNSITEVVAGRAVNLQVVRQERYRRGANGRGGRGRGRGRAGRGGRGSKDVKMSFSDF